MGIRWQTIVAPLLGTWVRGELNLEAAALDATIGYGLENLSVPHYHALGGYVLVPAGKRMVRMPVATATASHMLKFIV